MSQRSRTKHLLSLMTALALALPVGCDGVGLMNRGGGDDENDGDKDGICGAAATVDDACEAVFGEDVAECAPFDDVDEGCEHGKIDEADTCALAATLDDACEALFGDDDERCAPLDDLDEACEDDDTDGDDTESGDTESDDTDSDTDVGA
jgi:hypothetical protein